MVINNKIAPEIDELSPFYQLYVLLNTERGTVPLKRDLGLDPRLIDKPITLIRAGIQADIQGQINKYIKKLILTNVECKAIDNGLTINCEADTI